MKKLLKLIALGVICFVILVMFIADIANGPIYNNSPEARVEKTKFALEFYRNSISEFHKEKGIYPETISSLALPPEEFELLNEFISSQKGNGIQSESLSGKGGWFYNAEQGQIRVNLTEAVKEYLPNYNGEMSEAIPSEW